MKGILRNVKIRTRLLIGFAIMAGLVAIVGIIGVIGLRIAANDADRINQMGDNGILFEKLNSNMAEQRALYRDGALMQSYGLHDAALKDLDDLADKDRQFVAQMTELRASLITDGSREILNEIETGYNAFSQMRGNLESAIENNASQDTIMGIISQMTAPLTQTTTAIDKGTTYITQLTTTTAQTTKTRATSLTVLLVVVLLVAVALAVGAGLLLAHYIARPISELVGVANSLAMGDVRVNVNADSKDEVGELVEAFLRMSEGIQRQASALTAIANGDYTVTADIRSQHDVINKAINHMVDSNNRMISEIRAASAQVASGAQQISQGAQDLASGSSEQASSIEEFSAALTKLQEKSQENAVISDTVLSQVQESGRLMEEGTRSMEEMTGAMQDIDDKSQNISKVIKAIDDIAFQTNILALNAAVEAARAGQHGKGFAVVADEVRNLASKSAEAAKETAVLIEQSLLSVQKGNKIVQKTNDSLEAVGAISTQNAESIATINEASRHQSEAMGEITSGISQISSVVQANSATAEESAASAQQMSAQSEVLREIVSRFRLKDHSESHTPMPQLQSMADMAQGEDITAFSLSGGGDKY